MEIISFQNHRLQGKQILQNQLVFTTMVILVFAKPGECCTESFIIAGSFETEKEVKSFKTYLFTKIVRFLLLQNVVSQDVTKKNFGMIPDLEKL